MMDGCERKWYRGENINGQNEIFFLEDEYRG
jgi:hypothetical protein